MFSQEIIEAVVAAANANGWPASSLLAVVECETSGKPFEQDNHTPTLLFERHKFYSEMQSHAPGKLKSAIAAGLAIPKWSPKTQYKDQGKSASRLALIEKARGIDEEVANRAASWGLGQTMGFSAEHLHYTSATAMVNDLSKGVSHQIDALVREIKASKLERYLVNKDFVNFAKGYNGVGYKQNHYDTRMQAADAAWERRLKTGELHVKPGRSVTLVYQTKLKELKYPVGKIDGDWGDLTTGATSAFQRREGLIITGHPNDETMAALDQAIVPRPVAPERQNATVKDLKDAGSKTVKAAEKGSIWTKIMVGIGALGGANQSGALDKAKDIVDQAQNAKGILDSAHDVLVGLAPYWWVGAIVAGIVLWRCYSDVIEARLTDHQTAQNLGR